MKKRYAVALLGAAVVALSPALADHQWGNYHWARSSNPLNLQVVNAVDSRWTSAFNQAIGDWNSSPVLSLTVGSGAGVNTRKCNPIAGKALVCNDSYGQRGWLGIASIWASGDHITQATTKLNDSYHDNAPYNTAPWRELVSCQEIGHDFGLDHQDENFSNANLGTCMDYTNAPDGGTVNGFNYGPNNRHPNSHDYDELVTMYSHSDGGGGGGGGGGGCNPRSPKCTGQDAFTFRAVGADHPTQGAVADSGPWGRAVGFDKQGRPNKFELDLGNGHRKLTHVLWVPGFKPSREHMHD